jgi:hypothetical protein
MTEPFKYSCFDCLHDVYGTSKTDNVMYCDSCAIRNYIRNRKVLFGKISDEASEALEQLRRLSIKERLFT